ncbi:FAD binding domain-containing protein [Spelaeicoccus albus]|uniref:Carbon-monoxide dehydrogenase medium subunit n=1 Tax=Spelaeicoccus albus TaxID=1280376 RepID=A0A7Z0D461_9MICO|nr:FAD binding domain-containing protein [Spelaeicoccus albus]NYI68552.1 carbon-monoxide dehydrogenase medium subunit [Spelaeicoccus albus]
MKPSPLTYHRPATLEEACETLSGTGGKVLAGGQSLIPLLSMRLAAPADLIDINQLPGLDAIDVAADSVTFGALVRHTALLGDKRASDAAPLLGRALAHVAHPTIRNRGTTVGSIAHADPASEMPAVLTLLGGEVHAVSTRGRRTIPVDDFFLGPLETALAEDELAVAVRVPRQSRGEGTAIDELARRHGDYAMAGVAARVRLSGSGSDAVIDDAAATYISAGDMGRRYDFSDVLRGTAPDDPELNARLSRAGDSARDIVDTDADIHASADYRSQLVAALTARVLGAAVADAAGMTVDTRDFHERSRS